jgi:hypothetical protein
MADELLTDLDRVNWATVDHAYGPATDVPRQLRTLASGDETSRKAALWELWGNIWHQGTVYEATAYAVPFLARIARSADLDPERRSQVVLILAKIANGTSYLEIHGPLLGRSQDRGLDEEQRYVVAAHEAVAKEFDGIATDLTHADEIVLWSVAWLASQVSEVASGARPLLAMLTRSPLNSHLSTAVALTQLMVEQRATGEDIRSAASKISLERNADLARPPGLTEDRWARMTADLLYEDGFEEAFS